jgi:predicted nucleic acid-binding protein
MAQVTWRADDELIDRVRRQAEQQGRSMNEHLTRVLDALTNPELADDEAQRIRERLQRAGLLAPPGTPRARPDPKALAKARRAAGRGASLSDLVELIRSQGLLIVSQLVRVEVPAALWRKQRMGELGAAEAGLLVADFEADYFGTEEEPPRFAVVAVTPGLVDDAARFAGAHGLRAYDAVQLASACAAAAADPGCGTLAAFEGTLRTSAAIEGFSLLPALL